MKRPLMSIAGRLVSTDELRSAVGEASRAWLQSQRKPRPKAAEKREHRALTLEQREAKAQATAQAKKRRQAEREARELERLLARIGYLSRRSDREAAAMLRVRVAWRPGAEPKVSSVCPRNLYSRVHPEISARTAKAMTRSRVAADGFKNIVLRRTSRGYGRKAKGTREYRPGEAADLARYILREEGLEQGIAATLSNILVTQGEHALDETETFSVDDRRWAQIVAFWNALEAFEAGVDEGGNVFSHVILAMPHELTPEGRVRALEDFCLRLNELQLPFLAALHRPDPDGDIRNFHAHIMMASRPFAIEGPFAWSFEAAKATEFNLGAGIGWLREQAAEAFNEALAHEHKSIRYSGLSQARRGVRATGETHDGPVGTARKRKDKADRAERYRLAGQLVGHVARAAERLDGLAADIERAAARMPAARARSQPPPPRRRSQPQVQIPPALAALRQRFPDPLALKGLTALDFMDFTSADDAADRWYRPALDLKVEIHREREGLVRDRNGQPELIAENVKPRYHALLRAPALPDIVAEALAAVHRQIVAEEQRKKRIAREKEEIRQDRLAWLREQGPIILFDEKYTVLPEFRHLFPEEVVALDGVRGAMIERHDVAWQEEDRRIIAENEAAQEPFRFDFESAAQPAEPPPVEDATRAASAATTTASPAQPATQPAEPNEEDAYDLLLRGIQTGKVKPPDKGGQGR